MWAPAGLGTTEAEPTTYDHGVTPKDFITRPEGRPASPIGLMNTLQQTGFMKCPTPNCDFYLNPEQQQAIEQSTGYFTCPKCHKSYNLRQDIPYPQVQYGDQVQTSHEPGGFSQMGLTGTDLGQIGENVIAKLGEIPGYGPITWWHSGGAASNSTFDCATKDWAVEIKSRDKDGRNHYWQAYGGGSSEGDYTNATKKALMTEEAAKEGLQGVLGVLVILDFRRDMADVYVREMPTQEGVKKFYTHTAQHVGTFPFQSPFKDPNNPMPLNSKGAYTGEYNTEDYYHLPVEEPGHLSQPSSPAEEMPF